jgi:hypothetical protein
MAIEFDIQVVNGTVKITVGGSQANAAVIGPIVLDGSSMQGQGGQGGEGPAVPPGKTGGEGPAVPPGKTGGEGPAVPPGNTGGGRPGGGSGSCGPVVIGPIVITGCSGTASSGATGSKAVTVNPPAPTDELIKRKLGAFTMEPQKESNWCWAAVAVSIHDFLDPEGEPWTQPTLATQLLIDQGIKSPGCVDRPKSRICNRPEALDVALAITRNLRHKGALFNQHLTFDCIQDWVKAQFPVGARIVWRDGGAHFIALDGYKVTTSGHRMVHVQDPNDYPTSSPGFLDYDTLVEDYGEAGFWNDTYLVIQ